MCLGFVQLELREALRLQKRMVLIRETDGRHGAPLDSDGCFDLRKVFEHDPNDVGAFRQTLVNQQIPDAEIEMQITKKFPPVADDKTKYSKKFQMPGTLLCSIETSATVSGDTSRIPKVGVELRILVSPFRGWSS